MKKFAMNLVAVAAIAVCSVSSAFAGGLGSLGFADIGAPSVVGGNIDTGSQFTIGNLISTGSQSGDFVGLGTQIFGPVSFDINSAGSLSFGNAVFGSFASTSFQVSSSGPGFQNIYVLGNYTAGTYSPSSSGAASFTISFTQNPATTGSISDSATLSIPPSGPPSTVPEPSTLALLGLGGLGLAVRAYRRRQAAV
ncbi:MAG: PEP-CTERM sorting domain-containing protein [Schlesneria sp.]